MIFINKRIFESPSTITKMVEQIVLQGMLEESNFKINQHPITLTEDQIDWINEFIYPSNKIVHLKGDRQSGRTSVGIGMVLASALFQDRSTSMVLADSFQMSQYHQRKTLDYLRTFCEAFSLPMLITRTNRQELTFVNGSRIFFRQKSDHVLHGLSLTNLFFDFDRTPTIESISDELMACALPSISRSGKLIVSLGV